MTAEHINVSIPCCQCGHLVTHHVVDDEERRECCQCRCAEFKLVERRTYTVTPAPGSVTTAAPTLYLPDLTAYECDDIESITDDS